MKRAVSGLLAVALLLGLLGAGQAQTVRVGVTTKALDYLPIFLGKEKGLFREEGVNAELFVLGTSVRIFPALIGGSIEVFDSTLFVVLLGIEKGEKVEILGATTKHAQFHLVTKPEIRQVKDLTGKRVGSTGVGSGHYFSLIAFMEKQGMKFPGDYSVLTIGGTPEVWRSLEAGSIDAGVLAFPFHILARGKGFHMLAELYRHAQYPLTGITVKTDWAQRNEELLLRYLKGHLRAMEYTYTRGPEAEEVLIRVMGYQPDMARLGWEEYSRIGQWNRDLVISPDAVKTMMGFLIKTGEIKAPGEFSKYANPSYVAKANAQFKAR
ncbi:MAG: ABC transporter substrate-binding protein [Deltaproteobacteria bacterium]|nr:ABC transporter substrate-binding protein [Deltaproteobacteria bacterium]